MIGRHAGAVDVFEQRLSLQQKSRAGAPKVPYSPAVLFATDSCPEYLRQPEPGRNDSAEPGRSTPTAVRIHLILKRVFR